ncbi:MAG TPA: cation transporter [Polyangiaceae bacterium]|jgi:copper chaperone|nr:cation transporter [Polyangiaceae bacterium]
MLKLIVTGMTCDHCVRAVTSALRKVPNVQSVQVRLATGAVDIEGDPDLSSTLRAVREEGYDAVVANP